MKKTYLTFTLFLVSFFVFSQSINYNLHKGYIAEGYDVVAYFSNKTHEGKSEFTTSYDNILFKFYSEENLNAFLKSPTKYIPQYGGYCAYAIGARNKKVDIDPENFEIRDGKLYFFYDSWGTNTHDSWLENNPDELRKKADENWKKLSLKKS